MVILCPCWCFAVGHVGHGLIIAVFRKRVAITWGSMGPMVEPQWPVVAVQLSYVTNYDVTTSIHRISTTRYLWRIFNCMDIQWYSTIGDLSLRRRTTCWKSTSRHLGVCSSQWGWPSALSCCELCISYWFPSEFPWISWICCEIAKPQFCWLKSTVN